MAALPSKFSRTRWVFRRVTSPVHSVRPSDVHHINICSRFGSRAHANMLDAPDAALSDVAQRAGFADQAHFTRLFKREFGVTPGAVVRSRR